MSNAPHDPIYDNAVSFTCTPEERKFLDLLNESTVDWVVKIGRVDFSAYNDDSLELARALVRVTQCNRG